MVSCADLETMNGKRKDRPMNRRHVLLVAVLSVLIPLPAAAQDNDSHKGMPWGGRGANPNAEMAKRLHERLKNHNIPPALADPELVRRLLDLDKKFKGNPEAMEAALEKDPELRQAVGTFGGRTPEIAKMLEESRKQLESSGPNGSSLPNDSG